MSQVQSGILPEHCRAAIWIEASVKGEADALRAGHGWLETELLSALDRRTLDWPRLAAEGQAWHDAWHQLALQHAPRPPRWWRLNTVR